MSQSSLKVKQTLKLLDFSITDKPAGSVYKKFDSKGIDPKKFKEMYDLKILVSNGKPVTVHFKKKDSNLYAKLKFETNSLDFWESEKVQATYYASDDDTYRKFFIFLRNSLIEYNQPEENEST
jgi:hypothetical protein